MNQEVAPPLAGGRYRLTEVLGAGGMAVVYRAWDTRLETARAVKVLKSELDDRARQRFDVEARTMAKLHHPNVVLVHDVADDGDRAYLVMELIEGGSVSDRMAAFGPLPQRMACEVTMAVLDGLGAAHDNGVVHRDVKPHNMMVTADGVPKVTDFGIAQVADFSSTKTGTAIGTWAYMAPEQRADAKTVDARADLFGVGCSLYNMLTGTEPFDLYNGEIQDEVFADVPEAFHAFIQKACSYRADDRFATATEMQRALGELLPDLPDDPEGTPPLGVSLEKERADIVPTLLGAFPSSELSNPTLERRAPLEAPTETGRRRLGVVFLALAAIVFVGLGAAAGLAVAGGVVGISLLSKDNDGVAEIEPTPVAEVAPPEVPAPEVEPPVERDPLQPGPLESEEPNVDLQDPPQPVDAAPVEVVVPVPAPVERPAPPERPAPVEPAATSSPEPRLEPKSPDGTHFVSVNSRPWSMIGIDGGQYHHSPHRYALTPGRYVIELANGEDPTQLKTITLILSDSDKAVCWDFKNDARCSK